MIYFLMVHQVLYTWHYDKSFYRYRYIVLVTKTSYMLVSVEIYLASWDNDSLPCRCTSKQFRHMATFVANKLVDTIIDTSLLRTCEDTEILLILLAFIRPLSLPLAWLLLVRVCRLFGSGSFSYRQKLTVSGCKHL